MAGSDGDEAPMLSSQSQSQAIPSMSITMESHETGNNSVGSTGYLRDMNRHDKIVQNWDKFFVICCLVAIFLDPLFFFLLYVNQDNKCLTINWPMTKTVVVFRSLTDFVYLLNILHNLRLAYVAHGVDNHLNAYDLANVAHGVVNHLNPNDLANVAHGVVNHLNPYDLANVAHGVVNHLNPYDLANVAHGVVNHLNPYALVDVLLVLPLPQIMILFGIPKCWKSSGANHAKNLILWAVLIQYIPRLFRFLPLLVGQSPNGLIFETAWANFFINLFTFLLSAHVIGSGWYLLGFKRVEQCLREACNNSGFVYKLCLEFIDCGKGEEDNGNGFGLIWTKNENVTACFSGDSFEYGIYKQAVNLTSEDITKRYVYSLFWGFQQISTLAGNQQPSYFIWEVLFTMLIIGLGLLLFAFLIGNMQNFLQALDWRKKEFLLRQRDVKQWMSHRDLPEELKRRVRAAEKYNWEATRGVNEGMIIENLPEDIQRDIRRHMFFKSVETVQIFASMDQHILDAICERLKRTIYFEGREILYPGGVVDKMVFIVDGNLKSIGDDGTVTRLCKGSVCGEELATWFLEHDSVSKDGKKIKVTGQRLLSNRTVRCVTNVEAFSLGAADLEEFIHHFTSLKKTERSPPVADATGGDERKVSL